MQRSDARKRLAEDADASPITMHSDAHNGLTEAEREALKAAACGNCGERTAVLNLAARIKAEAVQAERVRAEKAEAEREAASELAADMKVLADGYAMQAHALEQGKQVNAESLARGES